MIRKGLQSSTEIAAKDHDDILSIERLAYEAMERLAMLQQYVPINACGNIHELGVMIGDFLQKLHAVDRALEICGERNNMATYEDERAREILETAPGAYRWNEAIDYCRSKAKKENNQ